MAVAFRRGSLATQLGLFKFKTCPFSCFPIASLGLLNQLFEVSVFILEHFSCRVSLVDRSLHSI